MTITKRIKIYILAGVIIFILAVLLVCIQNERYWYDRPYPGNFVAKEAVKDFPWLKAGIEGLVRKYSIPLEVMIFLSFYGAFLSWKEMRGGVKFIAIFLFIYPLLGFILAMLVIPLLIGIFLSISLFVYTCLKQSKKAIWFSSAAIVHNVLFSGLAWWHLRDWFIVFGD